MNDIFCPIIVKETAGIDRKKEPVRLGVPFPRKAITDPNALCLIAADGSAKDFQAVILEHWPDESVKWALFDFFTDLASGSTAEYKLSTAKPASPLLPYISDKLSVRVGNGYLLVDTQAAVFRLSSKPNSILDSVSVGGEELLDPSIAQLSLQDAKGKLLTVELSQPVVEESGHLRCSIVRKGAFKDANGKSFSNLTCRLVFWAGLSTLQIECTVHNPRAALHPGGLWDLGDNGSVYFNDFTLQIGLTDQQCAIEWQVEPEGKSASGKYSQLTLHQNSSGGKNWDSPNHLNYKGQKTVAFQGYRLTATKNENSAIVAHGLRATPWLKISNSEGWIAGTIEKFWQNFPNSLRTSRNILQMAMFPIEQGQPFELQGGEQKRHTVFLDFGAIGCETRLSLYQQPIEVSLAPEWIEKSKVIDYFSVPKRKDNQQYQKYIENIIEGEYSFFNKREIIDEYGWRNYGDTYADHEAVNHTGPEPFVSHYNNQYDFIYGACVHFLRSGDSRWWTLAVPAARHMIDIDIYRTYQDKAAYNGGLFWHTDHYQQAHTATHRAYSVKNRTSSVYGGGTSNEHIYTSGLTLYYFLTGDVAAKETVVLLAEYVLGMDDGSKTLFAFFDEGPTGLASQTVDTGFHHPGRGPGNCINCLLDAYRLSNERRYLTKAEELIQRCIHPADDIPALNLDDPEYRWSYLVFLQILGKYLDYKLELAETDYAFFYARDSLLHYAEWMAAYEVPYKEVLHKVLIPTETWPAHDIRKCHIFHIAAKFGPESNRQFYTDKARDFYTRCLDDLLSFETAYLARPLIILCVYGFVHDYFTAERQPLSYASHCYDFATPESFIPQRVRFKKHFMKKLLVTMQLARDLIYQKILSLTGR